MRLEYKFLVPLDKLDELRDAVRPFVYIDEYAAKENNKQYTVKSIYYDSMRLDDYRDKLAGLKVRKKLRIRGYNNLNSDSMVFLEIKRKYENHIYKNRAPLLYSDLDLLLETADYEKYLLKKKNFLDAKNDANKFFFILKSKNYSPIILISYEREAFYSKNDSTLRLTFDKNLRSSPFVHISELYDDTLLKLAMQGNFILEIKFYNGFPVWLQKIIRRFELSRRAISKYTICVDNHIELNRFVYKKNLVIPSILNNYKIENLKEVIQNA